MTKFKNSKLDKTQKLKIWPNSKTQNVTKLKNSKCYKTPKLKMWQNKIKIRTKLKTENAEKKRKKNEEKKLI